MRIQGTGEVQIPEIDFTQHVQDDGTTVSTVERVVKDVQAPAFSKPTDEQFFSAQDPTKPDIAFLKNHFYREGRLTEEQGEWELLAFSLRRREPGAARRGARDMGRACYRSDGLSQSSDGFRRGEA